MRITPTDKGYLLETGSGSVELTVEEALGLAPLARQIQEHIRSRFPHTVPLHAYEVSQVILGIDAHHTSVLLQVQGPDGLRVAYQLSLDTAKQTCDGLTRKIDQIERARTRQ